MEFTEAQLNWGKAVQGILDAKKPSIMTRADIPCPCDPGGSRLNCPYRRDMQLACEAPDHD